MKTETFEGSKEQIAERIRQTSGRVVRAIVDDAADGPASTNAQANHAWMAAFKATIGDAVVVGGDVDDGREAICRGRGE